MYFITLRKTAESQSCPGHGIICTAGADIRFSVYIITICSVPLQSERQEVYYFFSCLCVYNCFKILPFSMTCASVRG